MTTQVRKKDGEEQSSKSKLERSSTERQDQEQSWPEQLGLNHRDHPLLQLQQRHGNQAVQRLVKERLQPKLKISQFDDKYEREADWVAGRVMRMAEPVTAEGPEEDGPGGSESHEIQLLNRGRPLPKATRSFFEPRFGHNFSDVQIHDGVRAAKLSHSLNAHAFTYGRDIYFGSGNYRPETITGKQLLAHELTHVIQQRSEPGRQLVSVGEDSKVIKTSNRRTARKPADVQRHLPASIQRKSPSQPLEYSETTDSYYTLRDSPSTSGKKIGHLTGVPKHVRIINKNQKEDHLWYQIELKEPIGDLKPGAQAWIVSEGVTGIADWGLFIQHIDSFEKDNMNLTIGERITKLRQMSHKSDLPFDSVIGTDEGSLYLDQRQFDPTDWQLLKDYLAVRTPDGRIVDMNHLLVGLDVLPRKIERKRYKGIHIGSNYSAATWAGDIGAAVADAYLKLDEVWEARQKFENDRDAFKSRVNHYYSTRASEADLLGDIDAWAISSKIEKAGSSKRSLTITQFLRQYYESVDPLPLTGTVTGQTTGRAGAIAQFLKHYGFTSVERLWSQRKARLRIEGEIGSFAEIWLIYRKGIIGNLNIFERDRPRLRKRYREEMTSKFLKWLENLAKFHNVLLGS